MSLKKSSMKYIVFILFFSCAVNALQGQITVNCQDEIRIKNQKIAELDKSLISLNRQNGELQTKLILLGSGGGGGGGNNTPCPPTNDAEINQLKIKVATNKLEIEQLNKKNENKETLLAEAIKKNDKSIETIKALTKTNDDKEQELLRLNKDLEELKTKYAALEKLSQEASKSVTILKTSNQTIYDSLYLSINFKKETINWDIKNPDGKEPKLGDMLAEIPYSVINGTDWTANNIEQRMQKMSALFIKYRDKLRIQISIGPIETEEDKTSVTALIRKLMRKFNLYATVYMPEDNKMALADKEDFEIKLDAPVKKGHIRVGLVKK